MSTRNYLLVVLLMAAAGLALREPLLHTGFIVDDYAQLSMMAGTYPVPRNPLALFTFTSGDPYENARLRDAAFLPWWSDQALQVSLFRPLSSALMWFDRGAFQRDPWLYHLHSAGWWLLASLMCAVVARRFLAPLPALLVFALVILHPAHSSLLGWVANRNASVSSFFALLGLWVQAREREAEWRGGPLVSILCYALALAAGEYALGFMMVGLAYAAAGSPSFEARRAVVRAGPLLGLLLAYALIRSAFGFGARASGMYIDPASEPLAFLSAAVARLPVVVSDLVFGARSNWWDAGYPQAAALVQRFGLPVEWALDLRPLRAVHEALGLLSIAVAGFIAWCVQRAEPRLRFMSLALPLCLLPALGSLPESRLLLPALLVWCVLLVVFLTTTLARLRVQRGLGPSSAALLAALLVTLEATRSYAYSADDVTFYPTMAEAIRRSILDPKLEPVLSRARHALLVSATDPTTTLYIPMLRRWFGLRGPERCHLLLSTLSACRLRRLTATSFELERLDEHYTPTDIYAEVFHRSPLQAGQSFASGGLLATVQRVHRGLPSLVRFELDTSLDDPSVVLLAQTLAGLQVLVMPAVGDTLTVQPAAPPLHLMP